MIRSSSIAAEAVFSLGGLPFELLGFGLGAILRDMLAAGRRGDVGALELFHELRSGDGLIGVVGLLEGRPIRYTGGVICAAGARAGPLGLLALPEGVEEALPEAAVDEEMEDGRPLEEGVTEDVISVALVLSDGPNDARRALHPLSVASLRRLPPSGGTDGSEMESPGP